MAEEYAAESGFDWGGMMGGFLSKVGDTALDLGKAYVTAEIQQSKQADAPVPIVVGLPAPQAVAPGVAQPATYTPPANPNIDVFGVPVNKTALVITGIVLGGILIFKLID